MSNIGEVKIDLEFRSKKFEEDLRRAADLLLKAGPEIFVGHHVVRDLYSADTKSGENKT